MRDSLIFYRSFYEALRDLPKEAQIEIYTAIMEFSLYGNEVEPTKSIARSIFTLIKPVLVANIARRENGNKGGAPKGLCNNPNGRRGNKKISKQEQTENKPKTNLELTENKPYIERDIDIDNNINIITPLPPNEGDDEFERFWNLYDKKRGKAKVEAKFKKLSQADKAKIFETLPKYVESTPDVKYRKDPLTYLNGECWNDEIINDNAKQTQTPSNRQPVKDLSQYRDPTRHYETISDF